MSTGDSLISVTEARELAVRAHAYQRDRDGSFHIDHVARVAEAVPADDAHQRVAFMADSQVPWGVDALGGTISEPAWRNKPSWYLLTTEDRMIPPDLTSPPFMTR